ncbi:MAG: Fic family protein [Pseudolysinimonas sp.]|uniref:Fic/DOC family protein n=1 Tax=Pseudolysinimonas sp. TaxID=2680009 RepID=UPI0032637B7C
MDDRPWETAASEAERWAGYLVPGTDVLRNLSVPQAESLADLATFENNRVEVRLIELRARPVGGTFDADHLRGIHRHLFQDVYPWAGEFRTVGISKGSRARPDGSLSPAVFLPVAHIPFVVDGVAANLRSENYLRGLSNEAFADRLAVHFNDLNEAHGFREGNGRAQRAFWDELAGQAGHVIHWQVVSADLNMRMSHEARVNGNLEPLRSTLRAIVSDSSEAAATMKLTEASRLAGMDTPSRPGRSPAGPLGVDPFGAVPYRPGLDTGRGYGR